MNNDVLEVHQQWGRLLAYPQMKLTNTCHHTIIYWYRSGQDDLKYIKSDVLLHLIYSLLII